MILAYRVYEARRSSERPGSEFRDPGCKAEQPIQSIPHASPLIITGNIEMRGAESFVTG